MKASLFLALFCLAAVAVTTASAKNIEDVSREHENVEVAGNADGVEPLGTCSIGIWACVASCKVQGRNNGYCNGAGTCICTD